MRAFIYLCFLLSGVTGLVYEVLWGKYLQLFIGATSYAHTVVLATFMAGLAIGNSLFGRLSDRSRRVLLLYAILELGIGLSCALFPTLFGWLSQAYLALASSDPSATWNLVLKVFLAVFSILVPTVLMGGTLPVLARFLVRRMSEVGSKVGFLYFINSAGAMVGCLVAGFVLVPEYGLELSVILTAMVNIAIGVLFLFLRRAEGPGERQEESGMTRAAEPARTYSDTQIRGVYLVVGLTGALTMIYEVVWIRLLGLVLGSSTYSFSLMLFTFIGGIAVGGAVVARLMRKDRDALLLFALCELGVFAAMLLMMPLYERLPYYFNVLSSMLNRTDQTFVFYLAAKVVMSSLTMFLPALFIGMTLPLASRVAVRRLKILGTGVGGVFSVNTMGNVVGAVLGGFVLVPLLGLQVTTLTALFGSGLAGVVLYALTRRGSVRGRQLVAGGVLTAFVLGCFVLPRWDPWLLNAGMYRQKNRYARSFAEYAKDLSASKLLFHRDGPDLSVVVLQNPNDPQRIWLKVNGKTDASSSGDLSTQLHLGHIPMLLHPAPRDAMVIGLGSGLTAAAMLRHDLERLDVVEISDAVVEASRYFDLFTGGPLDDPRTRLHLADAKDFLQLQPDRAYDVIVSEPSNPWIAGIGNLFSIEFFTTALAHLKPGGIMVQWVQLYELDDRLAEVVFNTFSRVFKHVTVWHPGTKDAIIVGSNEPIPLDFELLEQRLASPAVHADLNRDRLVEKVPDALTFLSLQVASNPRFKAAYPGEGRLNTDAFPILEYEAPEVFFLNEEVQRLFHLDERRVPRALNHLYVAEYLADRRLDAAQLRSLIQYFSVKATTFDKNILPSLAAAFEVDGGGESVAQEFYLKAPMFAPFGRRALWKQRISSGSMSEEDWLDYLNFEAGLLKQFSTVFVDADQQHYELARRECAARFPEEADKLARDHQLLMEELGRVPRSSQ